MGGFKDLDEIYERDYREMPEHETSDTPPDMRPPAINYEPADFDEQGAVDHFAEMVWSGCAGEIEADRAYQAYVRRHRRGDGT